MASVTGWVFATSRSTPYGVRNVARRVLRKAADEAGLNDGEGSALRFHDPRPTFTSHLIVDLGLDVAQVSRILGHARITITVDVYTPVFDVARPRSATHIGIYVDLQADRTSRLVLYARVKACHASPTSIR